MNHDAPPAAPWVLEACATVYLYRPDDLAYMAQGGEAQLPRKSFTRYARWWLPLPARGDTVGIGDDPEYLTVRGLEWWPAQNAGVIELEAVRLDDPERFEQYRAAFDADGWLTEAQWQARP